MTPLTLLHPLPLAHAHQEGLIAVLAVFGAILVLSALRGLLVRS